MTACRGVQRADGVPTLEWMLAQTVAEPAPPGIEGDCLIWQRSKTDGYGKVAIDGKECVAHRVVYELKHGAVPSWRVMDHLCRRRDCVNDAHVEPVSQVENIRRGNGRNVVAARTGLCAEGHELTASGGRMRCKVCVAKRQREWYERKLAAGGSSDRRSA